MLGDSLYTIILRHEYYGTVIIRGFPKDSNII